MKKILISLTTLSLLSCCGVALAAGFQIQEQNALNLGTAFAGTAAWAADASSAYYNPAALTHIKCKQFVVSGVFINSYSAFTATSTNVPFQTGTPIPGPQTDNPGNLSLVPSMYYAARINPNLVFGMAVVAPFGLVTKYADDRVMRYVATHSELMTLDFSPSLAYKATSWLSLGAGLDALYADATLNAQTTYTSGGGLVANDGFQKNRANAWDLGWHAGLLVDLCDRTRIGLNYRSQYNLHAEGVSEQLSPVVPNLLVFRNVSANVNLPETVVLSAYHDFNACWAVMADVHWTAWSRFDTLGLRFDTQPYQPAIGVFKIDTDTTENFKDTIRVAIGVNHKLNKHWQVRAGTAFDQSPVREEYRTARVPDSDRIWLGIGTSYTCGPMRMDVGYAHLFFKHADLSDSGPITPPGSGYHFLTSNGPAVVSGNYSSHADILGVQLRYDFV